jgi:hypothetical protein
MFLSVAQLKRRVFAPHTRAAYAGPREGEGHSGGWVGVVPARAACTRGSGAGPGGRTHRRVELYAANLGGLGPARTGAVCECAGGRVRLPDTYR